MTSQSVVVVNQLGMHARAAAKFVHVATRYQARVRVAREAREMDGKSIMGILLLAAARGSTITISADGADENDAVRALVALVEGRIRGGRMQRLTGIGVSPGVVAGRAVILIQRSQVLRYQIAESRVALELERLEGSCTRSREQLTEIRTRVAERRPELASLFDAQLLMLDDPMLVPRAAAMVRDQRVNAEWAVQAVLREFGAVFDDVADPYLRERKGDVEDLVGRLRMNLRHGVSTPRDLLRDLDESSVLIADELTPSLAAQVDWSRVRGFATDAGSRTYHTAILARSLEVPAVVGLHNASALVQAGQMVVIDGSANQVILDPSREELAARRQPR